MLLLLVGLLLLFTGVIMNIKVLRGPLRDRLTSVEIMRTQPWLISVALIVVGFVLVLLGGR